MASYTLQRTDAEDQVLEGRNWLEALGSFLAEQGETPPWERMVTEALGNGQLIVRDLSEDRTWILCDESWEGDADSEEEEDFILPC